MISSADATALLAVFDCNPKGLRFFFAFAATRTYNTGDRTGVFWRLIGPQQR